MTEIAGPERWVALALLSGWVAVDTTEAVQLMVCQPLPAGCLAGLITGQPTLGLFIGTALQLLWSRLAPVGAASMPDVGPGTVAGVAVAASLVPADLAWHPTAREFFPPESLAVALLAGLLTALFTARASQAVVVRMRRANDGLTRQADAAAARGDFAGVERANGAGALRAFARGALTLPAVLLIVAALGRLAAALVPLLRVGESSAPPTAGAMARALPFLATNPGPVLFWWFGLAALLTTLWRGRSRDLLWLLGGLMAGGAVSLGLR